MAMDVSVWVLLVVVPLLVLVSSLLFLFRGLIGEDLSADAKHEKEETLSEKPKRKKKQKGTTPTPSPEFAQISISEKRDAASNSQQKTDKKGGDLKGKVSNGDKSKGGEKKKRKAKNKEKREETSGTSRQEVAVTEEEQAPGEWKETVSRKTKRERKVQLQKEQQPAVKEETTAVAAAVDIITDKTPQEISDELLKAAATDDLVGSTRESSGRASAGASSNSNPDLSDFVHIEMRSGEACEMTPEVVDSPSVKKKEEMETSAQAVAGQDVTDSIREDSTGATAKPQRQKKKRKRKGRSVGGGDDEDDDGGWEVV